MLPVCGILYPHIVWCNRFLYPHLDPTQYTPYSTDQCVPQDMEAEQVAVSVLGTGPFGRALANRLEQVEYCIRLQLRVSPKAPLVMLKLLPPIFLLH